MNEQIIQDWLTECVALSPGDSNSLASNLKHNNDLIKALFMVFEEYSKFHNLIEPISKQLFNFYRSKEFELKLFTLQFLPNLIYIHLNSVARGDKKSYHSIETLLIGIYNLEVVDENGQPAVVSFRMPSLAQASIYHEPMSLAHVSLTENALRRLEECNTKLITWGPHPQVEMFNAQNRLKTITKLLFIYNLHIASYNKLSLKHLCKVSSRLASQGFGSKILQANTLKTEGSKIDKLPRISVSFQFFLELLCGLYYALYNDFAGLAMQAVDDIYNRSCYECYSNVIAVTNAIKNSSQISSADLEKEGPMGISVALTPATTSVTTVNKFMITNASFRTKKLPDDIPIVQKEELSGDTDVAKPLTSITEEKEEVGFSLRGSSLRSKNTMAKNLQKLGIGKKLKDKETKLSSRPNISPGNSTADRKQPALQLSTFKEKISHKPGIIQNGEFAITEVNNHSSLISNKTRMIETDSLAEEIIDGTAEKVVSVFDYQPGLLSDGVDTLSNDETIGLFESLKNSDEKLFTRVSSV